jgi:hypothetical protein
MMVAVKFTVRQTNHLIPTLVCMIQFTLGIACLTVKVSNFLATLFRQLLSLVLVSLKIRVTHLLLPIRMQKRPGNSTRNIFQSNLHIVTHISLSYQPTSICRNLHITARSSLNCSLSSIHRTLLLRSNNVPLPGKTVLAKA